MTKRLVYSLLGLFVLLIIRSNAARAESICLISTKSELSAEIAREVLDVLDSAISLPAVDCFVITDVSHTSENTYLVSIAGISGDLQSYSIQDNASWFSVVALQRQLSGDLRGTLKGTDEFERMINNFPLTESAQDEIGGVVTYTEYLETQGYGTAYFPFYNMTSVLYGTLGVHDHGDSGWKAVDFVSWNDAGMAPNAVYASVAGIVTNICRDDTQMGLKIGPFYYLHMVNNPDIEVGYYFGVHDYIAHLVTGNFNDDCGYASQQPGAYHLHFAFAPVNHQLTLESWTLDTQTEIWTYGTITRSKNHLIGPADWGGIFPPPPPEDPAPTPTPGGPGEPTPTPGGPLPPPTPGQGNNGTNFWTFLTNGVKDIGAAIAALFPQHKEGVDLALSISEYANLPIKIVYITGVYNFKWPFIMMGLILILEFARGIYGIYMLVKRAIPVVG